MATSEFEKAFAAARKKGVKTFTWKGKSYTTELADGDSGSTRPKRRPSPPRPKARPTSAPETSERPKSRPEGMPYKGKVTEVKPKVQYDEAVGRRPRPPKSKPTVLHTVDDAGGTLPKSPKAKTPTSKSIKPRDLTEYYYNR